MEDQNQNKHSVTITIMGRKHTFANISPEEESVMRKAASMINEKVEGYRSKYEKMDGVDALCITSLIFVTQLIKEKKKSSSRDFEQRVEELNKNLEEYIKNIA